MWHKRCSRRSCVRDSRFSTSEQGPAPLAAMLAAKSTAATILEDSLQGSRLEPKWLRTLGYAIMLPGRKSIPAEIRPGNPTSNPEALLRKVRAGVHP